MKTDTNMTAAPVEFEVEGITHRLSPLRDKDFGEFERWVQDHYLNVAKRNLEGLSAEDRDALLRAAYDKASSITISSPEALTLMSTMDGAAYLLYLSLRREHPDLTFEDAKKFETNPVVLKQFMDRVGELNDSGEPKKRPFVKKKKAKKRAKVRKRAKQTRKRK